MPAELIADRFRIGEPIGSGGMGTVYRATDEANGEVVAVKVVHTAVRDAVMRFTREITALESVSHPNVVRYLASGKSDRGPFLVMEWLDGEDLARRMKREGLSLAEVVRLARDVADALVAVHAVGIIHRDIKPANVFYPKRRANDDVTVKVVDFGLARIAVGDGLSQAGLLVGTPGYMAPEQARGQEDLDGRVDVFGLGCLLYKCLTGQGPFSAPDAMATLAKILFDEPKPISELRADVPSALERLVMSMLAKERADRPSAAAVVHALASMDPSEITGEARRALPSVVGLTERERRVVTVVVASHADLGDAEETIERAPASGLTTDQATLRALAEKAGARLEILAGGVVATLFGRGAATDQASRAARLALGMRGLLGDPPISVATGRAEVGVRVVGDVIDRAMADAAAMRDHPGIWLDSVTTGLLGPELEVVVKDGRTRLVGASERSAGQVRTLLGKATPCVGRDRELQLLEALYAECESDSVSRVAIVTANAGVGKSRVRYEWLRRLEARAEPPRTWLCRGDPMSASAPFSMVRQWITSAANVRPDDSPETARQKLLARVTSSRANEPLRVAEFLGEMVDLHFPDEDRVQLRSARQDATLMGDQMRRAFEAWLAGEVSNGPLVLVLEDLHWGDLTSVKLIDYALKSLADAPLMVVGFARPEVEVALPNLWADRSGAQRISLSDLSPKASQRLVRSILGADAPDEVVQRIVSQSAGNAFFLEEIVRAHAEGRAQDSPETVRAVVQRRLENVDADARRVLRAASVFGQTFWAGGVLTLLGTSASAVSQVEGRLESLVAAEWIVRRPSSKLAHEEELIFRHAIVRDAAYDMLTREDRELGHRLAGDWLERAGERNGAVLAGHFDRGNAPDRAIAHYVRAMTQALEGSDLPAVVALGDSAIRCGASGLILGEVKRAQAEALRWQGRLEDAARHAREALELLTPGSPLWYSAASEFATANVGLGNSEVIDLVRDLLVDPARAADRGESRVVAMARIAGQAYVVGKRALAEQLVAVAESVSVETGTVAAARLMSAQAYRALYSSDPGPYYDYVTQARALYEAAGDLRNACVQATNQGYIAMSLGAFEAAQDAIDAGRRVAQAMNLQRITALAFQNGGLIKYEQGLYEEALALQRTAVDTFVAQNDLRLATFSRIYMAWTLLARGELDAATELARLAESTSAAMPPVHVIAETTLADLDLSRGDVAAALLHASAAHRQLEELGGVEDTESYVRVVYAEALFAADRTDEAKASLRNEMVRLAERAARIANPGWRETFRTRVTANARVYRRAKEWGVD